MLCLLSLKDITVTNNNNILSAKVVNFTLDRDSSTEWSALRDFSIAKNLESKYLSNDEITGTQCSNERATYSLRNEKQIYWNRLFVFDNLNATD